MKPARMVWIFWAGNAVLAIGITAFLWSAHSSAKRDRDAHVAAALASRTSIQRIPWRNDARNTTFTQVEPLLSPRERPRAEVAAPPAEPEPIVIEKTEAQLKFELDRALNDKFKVMRLMLCSSPEFPDVATVVTGGISMQWFEGMNLKAEYVNTQSMALDIQVLKINATGVLVNAPSTEKPDKRFDILLPVQSEPARMNFSADFFPQDDARKPDSIYTPPDQDSRQKAEHWSYPIPKEDYEDIAKYTKALDSGLQILPGLPKDSPARKYGARGGEIIKRINGECVKSMSDVRRIVRTAYDAGTREFKVEYERDGVPGERTFTTSK